MEACPQSYALHAGLCDKMLSRGDKWRALAGASPYLGSHLAPLTFRVAYLQFLLRCIHPLLEDLDNRSRKEGAGGQFHPRRYLLCIL